MFHSFSFTNDIGLDYSYWGSLGTRFNLRRGKKGCIINGVVYGDPSPFEEETQKTPREFNLLQNYPNPSNPTTIITYSVPQSSQILIKVYDLIGNEIATLVNGEKPTGEYEVEFNGSGLPSGIYYYQLKAGQFVETKKMILLI